MIADITLAANNRAVHHMGKGPDAGTPTDRCRLNESLRMDKDVCGMMQVFDPYSAESFPRPLENGRNRFKKNLEIPGWRPIPQVLEIEFHHLLERKIVTATDLPFSRQTG